jgi:hypothetical protein
MLPSMMKSGFAAAFFMAVLLLLGAHPAQATQEASPMADVDALVRRADQEALHLSPQWQALLHYSDDAPRILDPGFLLSSHTRFSLANELRATLHFLYDAPNQDKVCRFPARYIWLRQALNAPELPIEDCAELNEFKRKAPMDRIALVFASEILSQPSSIMGHLFIKVSGSNEHGQEVDHAISFFTDQVTANLPKLFYDSLIKGMNGYFTLAPYRDETKVYIDEEHRNLWAYTLKLDEQQRTLIQHHLHELRHTTFTYFFQKYNCATLVKHIVAIAQPEILNKRELWTTPKDVIKLAHEAGLIQETNATTANRWAIRIFQDALPGAAAHEVKQSVLQRTVRPAQGSGGKAQAHDYLALELANVYNNYLLEQQTIDKADWQRYAQAVTEERDRRQAGLHLETAQQKDPVFSPQDAQWTVGWQRRGALNAARLDFLPISHGMSDDNRSYFGENELKLFEISVVKEEGSGHVDVDRFVVYSAASLLPRDIFTGGLSGKFRLGMDQQWESPGVHKKAVFIEGGLGLTWPLSRDMEVYGMAEGGLGHRAGTYVYAAPSVGVVIREIFNMKSMVSMTERFNALGKGKRMTEWSLTQSKYIGKDFSLHLQLTRRASEAQRQQHESVLLLKRVF